MENAWPPLKECVQFKIHLMGHALRKYPWEKPEYEFDFSSFYPPIPDELASLRKLLVSLKKIEVFPPSIPEDIRDCPICLHQDLHPPVVDILNAPVWDMDPIPCPYHLAEHVWPFGGAPNLVTPQELDDTKKYLNQVRHSRGYDVDCVPHDALVTSEFWKVDLESQTGINFSKIMKPKLDSTAIKHINSKTGKIYKLEDILKIVFTQRRVYLVTFTAKVENDDSADCDTFIATIDESTGALKECMLKPGCDAPGPDHYPDFIIQPIEVPSFSISFSSGKAPEPRKRKFKDFSFRGKNLNDLCGMPISSQVKLIGARAKRTFQRGLKRKRKILIKKLRKAKREAPRGEKPALVRTHLRNMIILPEMIGCVLGVYNGKTFNTVEIKPEMIGHYTAEFSISYKPIKHGRPGIGATHSSRFIPLK